jgi:hypothetical protein
MTSTPVAKRKAASRSYVFDYFKICLAVCFIFFNLYFHFQNPIHDSRTSMSARIKHLYSGFREPTVLLVDMMGEDKYNKDNEFEVVRSVQHLLSPTSVVASTTSSSATTTATKKDNRYFTPIGLDESGIESQYAEVEWVRGIQDRRKLGLEPSPEDPYSDIPDHQLFLPLYLLSQQQQSLNHVRYVWKAQKPIALEMHFVHVPKAGGWACGYVWVYVFGCGWLNCVCLRLVQL